jgi:hypothetical protein
MCIKLPYAPDMFSLFIYLFILRSGERECCNTIICQAGRQAGAHTIICGIYHSYLLSPCSVIPNTHGLDGIGKK